MRTKARATLVKILLALGARYVKYFITQLTTTLQKGFQVGNCESLAQAQAKSLTVF